MNHLLAKSFTDSHAGVSPPRYARLTEHTRDVVETAGILTEIIGSAALQSADLSERMADFRRALRAFAWIHDIGKANSHFQELVTSDPRRRQLVRHEAVSAILFSLTALNRWLEPLGDNALAAIWAAAGHHRKFHAGTLAADCSAMVVHVTHPDFQTLLASMATDLGLGNPPQFSKDLLIGNGPGDFQAGRTLTSLKQDFETEAERYKEEDRRRFIGLVKAFGIAADVAASAVPRRTNDDAPVVEWIGETLQAGHLDAADLDRLIKTWAEKRFSSEFVPRPFQSAVAGSTSTLTLAAAGCGSGKSAAAYMWAKRWSKRFAAEGRSGKLFLCLPTTGTATEHFKDYALEADVPASLAHSRASIDLEAMARTSNCDESGDAAQRKIEALELWGTPLVVATADTVLGLMANTLRALCSAPAILSGTIVFDEIHAFDEAMFGHLLVFLKNFPRIPVLLMTASLQPGRLEAIRSIRPDLQLVSGPPDLEQLPRYLPQLSEPNEATEAVRKTIEDGGKVLWIRNRVSDANETYRRCRSEYGDVFVQVYHSRFRYVDRARRHRDVIDAFLTNHDPAILVATQVAEISLDISADLLVTDIAPVSALIQRMGRLNRRVTPENPGVPRPAHFIRVPTAATKPYEKEDVQAAAQWLKEVIRLRRPLSQNDLTTSAERFQSTDAFDIRRAEQNAVFFSGLWATEVRSVRDEGHTVSVILEKDWREWTKSQRSEKPDRDWLRRHEVAIPLKAEVLRWSEKAGHLPIAPNEAVSYSWDEVTGEGTGAEWRAS